MSDEQERLATKRHRRRKREKYDARYLNPFLCFLSLLVATALLISSLEPRRIASLRGVFIDRDHPVNQTFLILGKLFRQSVNREPFSLFDLKAAWLGRSHCARAKISFDLPRTFQRPYEQQRNIFDLDPDLFAQFAAQPFFRLLISA